MENRRTFALSLTLLGAISRLLPHPPNFTAVGASSLFAGAKLRGWQAYLVPLLAMIITDPIIAAFYGVPAFGKSRMFVYLSLMISVLIGRIIASRASVPRITAACLAGSLQFFLITNFGVWLGSSYYPQSAAGLGACYLAGLPFFERTALGDLFFTAILFGAYAWLAGRDKAVAAAA